MKIISLVVAMDESRGIGKNNQLLCHLPADLKYFKQLTLGKPIIMGRKTYDSIGKPLPGRANIVISHQQLNIDGVKCVHSLEDALAFVQNEPEVMIIGGGQIFKQAIPYANRIYLTIIHHEFNADIFFPEFDEHIWACHSKSFRPSDEKNAFDVTNYCLIRKETINL